MLRAKMPPMIESSAIEFLNEKFSSSGRLFELSIKFFSCTSSVEYEPSSKITVLKTFFSSTSPSLLLLLASLSFLALTQIGNDPMVALSLLMALSTSGSLVKKLPAMLSTTLISYLEFIWSNESRIVNLAYVEFFLSASTRIFFKMFSVESTASLKIYSNPNTFSIMNLRMASC